MTDSNKKEIIQLIQTEVNRLGTASAVANKCGLSETTISQILSGKYHTKGDTAYYTIKSALGYEFSGDQNWIVVETTDYKTVTEALVFARKKGEFLGIANNAGSGKTSITKDYVAGAAGQKMWHISCRRWNEKRFLIEVVNAIGADIPRGYHSADDLIESICETFNRFAEKGYKPQLIIDQANSLKPGALQAFIYIYNACERRLSVVIAGTDNLEHEIKKGARLLRNGYDEIGSRFQRFLHLTGATLADCIKICDANGITSKDLQKEIFNRCNPTQVQLSDGRSVRVIKDLRELKRIIVVTNEKIENGN